MHIFPSPCWLNPAIGITLQPLSTSNDCTGKRFARSLERSLTFQRSGLATREYMQRCPDFDGWRVRRLRRFYGGCAREGFGPAGFPVLTGSPTCVQLPPFRLATSMWQLHYDAKNTAFSVGAGLPAMALAGRQRVRGVGIVGKPTPTGCASALSPCWLNPAIGIILQPLSTSSDCTGKRFARSLERSLTFQRSGLATWETIPTSNH